MASAEINGADLVRRARGGDGVAWEEIVTLFSRRIFNLAYRFTSNADAAEDLTQEVFIRIYRTLDQYDAKATFFCVGDNVRKYPEIFEKVIEAGHNVGNHTFNHLNGWQTGLTEYVENINKCSEYVESNLFRPPYGKISRRQAQMISHHFKVVMWDVLSGDFDQTISKTTCLENVINYANSGSIVVFHDNIKSFDKLQYVLPKVLSYFSKNGYTFKSLQSAKTLKRTTELVPA